MLPARQLPLPLLLLRMGLPTRATARSRVALGAVNDASAALQGTRLDRRPTPAPTLHGVASGSTTTRHPGICARAASALSGLAASRILTYATPVEDMTYYS